MFIACAPQRIQSGAVPNPSESGNLSLFSDGESFSIEDVKNGKTCGSVKNGSLTFTFVPWPAEVKLWLTSEFLKLKLKQSIVEHIQGVYLARYSKDLAQGITCHDAKTNKMVVMINAKLVESRRAPFSPQRNTAKDYRAEGNPVLEDRGDDLLQTFVHEMFHVLDLAFYYDDLVDYIDKKSTKKTTRVKLYEMSWSQPSQSIFETKSATKLTGYSQSEKASDTDSHPLSAENSFALSETKGHGIEFLKSDLLESKRLASATNFFSPYASSNFLEDFAVSLESIYMGKTYDSWYRKEFFSPLSPFLFSTEKLLNESSLHREKKCLIQTEIFEDPC